MATESDVRRAGWRASRAASLLRRAKRLATDPRIGLADALWALPLAAYRLSGRRVAGGSDLYRAGILRQRRLTERVSGMTAESERAYYRWHARERFGGTGTIADLGCGFGSTTVSLVRGLCANPRPAAAQAVIHAFDRFVWEDWMAPYAHAAGVQGYGAGDSFLPEFEAAVAQWRDRVQIHPGDLIAQTWAGEPIELLLVDVMKSWPLTTRTLSEFYPALVPGIGYLIHQDFAHCYTPWIHLVSYRLREHLVPVIDVVRSETVVFKLVRGFDDPAVLTLDRRSFDDAEVEAAFRHSASHTRTEKHSGIFAAQCLLSVYDGDLERAAALLERFEDADALNGFHRDAVREALDGARREQARV